MAWRTIGRPGLSGRLREQRRRTYDAAFGPGSWRIRHLVGGTICEIAEAARHCELSYLLYFQQNPALLDLLCDQARDVYAFAHSNTRSGLDYSVQERKKEHVHDIMIRRVLQELGRSFRGEKLIHIDFRDPCWGRLHPGRVPFYKPELILQPALQGWWDNDSVECFWQSNKVLQVNQSEK